MGNQYSTEQTPSAQLLAKSWRDSDPLNSEHLSILKKKVESYRPPPDVGTSRAKILMLGPVGAGKSSFFNTVNSIFQDRIALQAMVGSNTGSLTTKYRQYRVRSKDDSELNFSLCDTSGIAANKRPDMVDLNYLLEGNVPDQYTFSAAPINPTIDGFIPNPGLEDKVHCVVYVFSASSVKTIPEDIWVKLNELQSRLNDREIPRVILLTKIDELSEALVKDVSKVFLNNDVKKAVDYISGKLKFPPGNVMPIKNYEKEGILNNSISCLALQALDRILGYANDYLVNQRDQRRTRRPSFGISFYHADIFFKQN